MIPPQRETKERKLWGLMNNNMKEFLEYAWSNRCKNGIAIDIRKIAYDIGAVCIEDDENIFKETSILTEVNIKERAVITADVGVEWTRVYWAIGVTQLIKELNSKSPRDTWYYTVELEKKNKVPRLLVIALGILLPRVEIEDKISEYVHNKKMVNYTDDTDELYNKLSVEYGVPKELVRSVTQNIVKNKIKELGDVNYGFK